jgi:hypothetical protein
LREPLLSNTDDVTGVLDESEAFEPVVGSEFSGGMTTLMPSSAGNSCRGLVRARAMALKNKTQRGKSKTRIACSLVHESTTTRDMRRRSRPVHRPYSTQRLDGHFERQLRHNDFRWGRTVLIGSHLRSKGHGSRCEERELACRQQ